MRTPYAGQASYAQSRCFADPDVAAAFANEFNSKSASK
jgi:hypothetical protein